MAHRVDFGGFSATYLVRGADTDGRFSLVEHEIAPQTLASPVHTHTREDEYSLVTQGRIGVMIGDEVREASTGELVVKPRGIPHAFWNASDEPAKVVELISPAGFEDYFAELAEHLPPNRPEPDLDGLMATAQKYGLAMDPASIPTLMERFGLRP